MSPSTFVKQHPSTSNTLAERRLRRINRSQPWRQPTRQVPAAAEEAEAEVERATVNTDPDSLDNFPAAAEEAEAEVERATVNTDPDSLDYSDWDAVNTDPDSLENFDWDTDSEPDIWLVMMENELQAKVN